MADGFCRFSLGYIQAAKNKTEEVYGNLPLFEPIFYIFMEKKAGKKYENFVIVAL